MLQSLEFMNGFLQLPVCFFSILMKMINAFYFLLLIFIYSVDFAKSKELILFQGKTS